MGCITFRVRIRSRRDLTITSARFTLSTAFAGNARDLKSEI